MQNSLFGDGSPNSSSRSGKRVSAVVADPAWVELAESLSPNIRLGTSSWSFPGWAGLVWDGEYSETVLSRYGLTAYSQHPLFRSVSIDRGFYRALNVAQYAEYASQVNQDFRFVVKAPSAVTDALVRDESGRGMCVNPNFLSAEEAVQTFVTPALEGLRHKLGALVFQISPLPDKWLAHMPKLIDRLHYLLSSLPSLKHVAPDGVIAVEVRDSQWLTKDFVEALRDVGATYCLGLHAKMPRISEQLPILRALWPGPMVCRWNLNPLHGAYGYENARDLYLPFDKMVDPDVDTRAALTRVIKGSASAGQNVFVTISNKAEGCAPLSVIELAKSIRS